MAMVMVTDEDDPVEIVQNEKSREDESGAPEWIHNPVIQIIIIPGRRIVSNHRGTFLVVVVVYYGGVRLGLVFSILIGATRDNSQTKLSGDTLECL